MKKTILTLIITLCCLCKAEAQECTLPYKSLAEFDHNTEAFITYNFVERATCYDGKTLTHLLEELQITPIASGQGYLFGEDGTFFSSIRLYVSGNGSENLFVQINWKEPAPMPNSIQNMLQKYGTHAWIPRYAEALGEYKVGRIFTNQTFNKHRKKLD